MRPGALIPGRLLMAVSMAIPALATLATPARAADPAPGSEARLREKYQSVREQLTRNAQEVFRNPIVLESVETSGSLKGDVYAVVAHPMDEVLAALRDMAEWCDLLILHLNVKYCRSPAEAGADSLTLFLGRKVFQPLPKAYRLDFAFRVVAATPDYLEIMLAADRGPFGTRDYRIVVRAVSIGDGRSFIHLSYAYAYGFMARVAMQAYLATFGSDKVGFTVVGTQRGGQPQYVEGVRGVLERNTVRYYLAIEVFLDALSVAAPDRPEKRLNDWFDASERYALQLHEVGRDEYLQMKREEYRRQRSVPVP